MMKKSMIFALSVCMAAMLLLTGAVAEEIQTEPESNVVEGYSFTISASPLTYGMKLEDSVIDASGSTLVINGETVPAQEVGAFYWREPERVPGVGPRQCQAYFSPFEALNAVFPDEMVTVQVNKARPVITELPKASELVYGQSLSQSRLMGGTAMNPINAALEPVQGIFEWELRDMVPSTGVQEATVVFTPIINAADLYETVYFPVQVNVLKLPTKLVEYPVPARALRYGEALNQVSLEGGYAEDEFGQEVPGTFAFINGEEAPSAGVHTAEAVFTPLDYAHRSEVYFSVQVTVEKPVLTLAANPVDITYGQTLSQGLLQGQALNENGQTVPGTWAYADGAFAPTVSQSGMYDAVFTPDDLQNYEVMTVQVQVNVHKAQLFLVWQDNGKYMGEADGSLGYAVPGIPDGAALIGVPSREEGEAVGAYAIYADALNLPQELEENYLLIKENGVFTIRQYEAPSLAVIQGGAGENGWYTESVQLTAPAGHEVALAGTGAYAETISLPESAQGADYYLRVTGAEHQGALAGPYHADYRLDASAPELDVVWQEGNEFTLAARDSGSGVDRIYGIFAGPVMYYDGAAEVEYAYAARETGNYTYVVHDRAGHTAVVTLDFADTDQDGLTDVYEEKTGTSVELADTDADGVSDFAARRIRNLLGYERLDVAAAVMLGALTDGGEEALVLPDATRGVLEKDESAALRPQVHTGRGLMRVNLSGCYGLTGDVLWFESEQGAYSAIHLEGVGGKVALSCNAPGGVIALCSYDGKTLDRIRVADVRTGHVMLVQGSEDAARFDLSADAKYLAYEKAGIVTVLSLETGLVEAEVSAEAGCVFRFGADGKLVMESSMLQNQDGRWTLADVHQDMRVRPLVQPVRGESVMWIGDDTQGYVVRATGSALRKDGNMTVEMRGICNELEGAYTLGQELRSVMEKTLCDVTKNHIESLNPEK